MLITARKRFLLKIFPVFLQKTYPTFEFSELTVTLKWKYSKTIVGERCVCLIGEIARPWSYVVSLDTQLGDYPLQTKVFLIS